MTLDYKQLRKEFEKKKLEARQYWKKKEDPKIVVRKEKEQRKQDMWEYLTNPQLAGS